MRILPGLPNTNAVDGDYLYGGIRDNPGDETGTPFNEFVYGDIHQLMARMAHLAGMSANGLPDNDYSGWQLFDAFVKYLRKYGEHYRYTPAGTPFNLSTVDVRRNVHVLADGVGSGGIIQLPDLGDINLHNLDTVTVSNYCSSSVDLDTFASNQYIGGYGTSSATLTVAASRAIEIILIDNGIVRFWLKSKLWTIS